MRQGLRPLASYEAKRAKISNFWIFWSIILLRGPAWLKIEPPIMTEIFKIMVLFLVVAYQNHIRDIYHLFKI